ncbi:MAG: NAD(P)-binding domain-containing protein, partial [Aquificaceae bacterium]
MTLGIIGYGNMGESFARSLREHAEVLVYDISEEKRSKALSE